MKNKNLKIQKIQTIENINQNNLNIPVGQIVLINVNKTRESGVQQEPLEQVENELIKKDADYLTKTKNTFTDKKPAGEKGKANGFNSFSGSNGKQQIYEKHQPRYQQANNSNKYAVDKRQASADRLAADRPDRQPSATRPTYQTPKIEPTTNVDQSNLIQHQQNVIQQLQQQNNYLQNITNIQLQQQHANQPHNQPNRTPPRLDRAGQLKQSTISLNHHYEQPDMLLSKATSVSIIRSNEKSAGSHGSSHNLSGHNVSSHNLSGQSSNRTSTYDTIDGQSISPPRLPANSAANQSPHYEKPIINHNKPKPLIRNGTTHSNPGYSHGKQPLPIPKSNQLLDDTEVNQIELFYRSQKTYVFVSRSMANLYFTQTDLINNGRCVL